MVFPTILYGKIRAFPLGGFPKRPSPWRSCDFPLLVNPHWPKRPGLPGDTRMNLRTEVPNYQSIRGTRGPTSQILSNLSNFTDLVPIPPQLFGNCRLSTFRFCFLKRQIVSLANEKEHALCSVRYYRMMMRIIGYILSETNRPVGYLWKKTNLLGKNRPFAKT